MVVHDLAQYISQDLVKYTHQSLYDSIRSLLGKGPVFNAIGNHDSAPSDFASQGALPMVEAINSLGTGTIWLDCGKPKDGLITRKPNKSARTMRLLCYPS